MKPIYVTTPDGEYLQFPADAPVVDEDVRDVLRAGGQPFDRIMAAVDALPPGQVLRVRATFAPAPLIGLLSERGFAYRLEEHDAGDWSVWFWVPDRTGRAP
ncbi:MAG: DUF2249 domain-containing protein [Gemmatimonadota bacterium]|nr:DUF2249 domain-containing protein [Gemmatimonadota bacterium]